VRLRLDELLPDPGHFWVRWAPQRWPGPGRVWLDLSLAVLRREEDEEKDGWVGKRGWEVDAVDDLLYLPPVGKEDLAERADLARRCSVAGTPVLLQEFPGEDLAHPAADHAGRTDRLADGERATPFLPTQPSNAGAAADSMIVLDLLDGLLRGDLAACDHAPAGAAAAWPLLPGATDDPALWEEGCARLAASGVRWAQGITVQLTPQDRRWLAERRPDVPFEVVFHREPPPERAFDRVAHRHGLAPFPPRPLPRGPRAVRGNRRAAAALALAGELWLRLGRPVGQGETLYRAARFADRSDRDLEALAREGNLGLLDWLDPLGMQVVEDLARTGLSGLVEALRIEYVAP
jgi:hypothetical protein